MSFEVASVLLLLIAVVFANAPWLGERPFMLMPPPPGGSKSAGLRLLEWLIYYGLILLLALGLERQVNGVIHQQQWEFYAVTVLMFAVLAMPGFLYHYDLRHYLRRWRKRREKREM